MTTGHRKELSMTSSENRSVTSEELIALRLEIGHTQQEAADYLYVTKRTYQNWEYKKSRMPLAIFELYVYKAIAGGKLKRRPSVEPKGN